MAEKEKRTQEGLDRSVQTLATALAEKGTGGMVLLGLICLAGWVATLSYLTGMFLNIPKLKPPYEDGSWIQYTYLSIMLVGALLLALLSYGITRSVLKSIVGTIRAEAEAKALTTAFGGRVAAADGSIVLSRLSRSQARRRIQEILKVLVGHTSRILSAADKDVRANVFTTKDGLWLTIADQLYVNMDLPDELKLRILNGFYSTGTAFKYSKATLSVRREDKWQYQPDVKIAKSRGLDPGLVEKSKEQIKLAHPDLQWIISMPIPYQVNPFALTCGVVNLDGFQKTLHRDQLKILLADAPIAAALIGVVNRTTDILNSACERPDESFLENPDILAREFTISATEFDPAECPEPTPEFEQSLSKIQGLEFLKGLSTSDLAFFLREQLRY